MRERFRKRWRINVILGLTLGAASSCAGPDMRPVVATKALPGPIVSRSEEVLDPHLLEEALGNIDEQPYRVGPGDTLLVAVYNHPELAVGTYAGSVGAAASATMARTAGLAIDNDGTIQFPMMGAVQVAGKTAEQLRIFLERELGRYVRDPKVIVQVIFNGNIRYYLLGQFVSPGLKFSDRPMRLLEALSLGGSVQMDHASLSGSYVARGSKKLPVNFRRLLRDGDMRQNIPLRNGDTIVVPDNLSEQAFVFAGAAGTNAKGGAVPFVNGRLDILQALAQSGIGFAERAQGKLSEVRVIRSEADRGEFFVIDVNKILAGQAGSFSLAPGDIVFVPETAMTTWNEALLTILPTLQTISGILEPFVQIKFLSQ